MSPNQNVVPFMILNSHGSAISTITFCKSIIEDTIHLISAVWFSSGMFETDKVIENCDVGYMCPTTSLGGGGVSNYSYVSGALYKYV